MAQAADGQAGLPAHEIVYRRLRKMILFGELAPGQAVTIQGLVERLDVGITPVREAIRRLTAEAALEALGNRRIAVPELTIAQLDEITFLRQHIEPHLASMATRRAGPPDIERLSNRDADLNDAIKRGDVRGYLEHNYEFHRGLYLLAGQPVMQSVTEALWLRVGPSLRVVCGRFGTANLPDKHAEALSALRAGDEAAVARAIADDIAQGDANVRQSIAPVNEPSAALTV